MTGLSVVISTTAVFADAEAHVRAICRARLREVLEDVGLRVEPDRVSDQSLEVDAVAHPAEPQIDALVGVPFPEHPVRDTRVDQQSHAVGLEDAGAYGLLDLLAAPDVDGDGLDPGPGQQMRQHQAGRPGAHDADAWCGSESAAPWAQCAATVTGRLQTIVWKRPRQGPSSRPLPALV